jgi:tripartite-type tricarboxylate transporter receptor subunit TctC
MKIAQNNSWSFPRKWESIWGVLWHSVMDSRFRGNDRLSFARMAVNSTLSGLLAISLVYLTLGNVAYAAFPEKPIRIVVPSGVGGAAEMCMRAVTEVMRADLGQHIVIENVPGATGNIGLERVHNAMHDGYTLSQASAANTANLAARPKVAFDILNNFKPVGKVCQASFTLAVAPSLNVKTVDEFIRYAKTQQGKLSFASIGHGSSQHLVGEMFVAATGLDMTHVPYRGEPLVVPEMAAGRIHMMFMAGAKPFMDGGLVMGIATTNRDPWAPIPNLPPIGKTSALPGFSYNGWNGLFAPKGTPDAAIKRLSAALVKALADEKVRATIRTLGNEPGTGTPEELAATIRSDLVNFRRIIEQRKLSFPE